MAYVDEKHIKQIKKKKKKKDVGLGRRFFDKSQQKHSAHE